jgi:hypothetical protein
MTQSSTVPQCACCTPTIPILTSYDLNQHHHFPSQMRIMDWKFVSGSVEACRVSWHTGG